MDRQLQLLSERLSPPLDWLKHARKVIDYVFDIIRRKSKYDIDRVQIVGGMEKKTSTFIKVDVDTVIFYNDKEACIRVADILSEWEDILLLNTDLTGKDIHSGRKLLTFRYEQIPIDLVAARNNVNSTYNVDVERRQMWNDMKDAKRSNASDSSKAVGMTLSAANVKWMKEKSKFAHDIARLAKFWSQTILFNPIVPGMSYIFEQIAVKAAKEEEARGSRSYMKAFKRFIEMVRDIKNMKIIFTDEYNESDIPASILKQIPLLMDCVNPYHNLLDLDESVKSNFFHTFSNCAIETLNRLESETSSQQSDMSRIFVIQPVIAYCSPLPIMPLSGTFLVGIHDDSILIPKPETRNVALTSEDKRFVDILLHAFSTAINALPANISEREKKVYVGQFINNAMNVNHVWRESHVTHESKQCTLRIPIGNGRAVYISFDFDLRRR